VDQEEIRRIEDDGWKRLQPGIRYDMSALESIEGGPIEIYFGPYDWPNPHAIVWYRRKP